jgi:hypothetical protein
MTFDTNLWNQTKAEGFSENETPPPGVYLVTVTEAKFAQTGENKDKPTIIVEYRTADGKQWADVKTLTSEGRIKSAKILLRDLGLDPDALTSQEAIHAGLKSIEGTYYDVTVKASNSLNPTTGQPYLNTYVNGKHTAGLPTPSPTIETGAVPAATADTEIPF